MISEKKLIDKLITDEKSLIYIATRLFNIENKISAELLERSVISGVKEALLKKGKNFPRRTITFVPFRDSGQENLVSEIKTRILYEQDIERLNRTLLLVTNIDGLSKDEGICFELGYAYAKQATIILISTDFISIRHLSGQEFSLDPILIFSANSVIRTAQIAVKETSFLENLKETNKQILDAVSKEVKTLMLEETSTLFSRREFKRVHSDKLQVFVDFGGELFEWQSMLAKKIVKINENIMTHRPLRYLTIPRKKTNRQNAEDLARLDLERVSSSQIVILCSDADECHSGTAFIQGFAKGLGLEVWLYDSKKTKIVGLGGYESSRNLMLDYSADRVFKEFYDLVSAVREL